MKNYILLICLILLGTCISKAEYVKVWDSLNVRASSNPNSQLIDELPRAHYVVIKEEKDDWSYIKYVKEQKIKYGWVKSEYLTNNLVVNSDDSYVNSYLKELEELETGLKHKYKIIEDKQRQLIEKEYVTCMAEVEKIKKCRKISEDCVWNSGLSLQECKDRGLYRYCGNDTDILLKCSNKRFDALHSIDMKRYKELLEEKELLRQKYNINFEPVYTDVINIRIVN